ncbi:MAG: glycosyltransferase [Pseudoalteromonas sp.]
MIHFIQPVLAKYRHSFFQILAEKYEVSVSCSKIDFLGVKSYLANEKKYSVSLLGDFISIFGVLFWQKGISFSGYSKTDVVVISGNPRVVNQMLLLILCKIRGIKVVWWGQGWTAGNRGFFARFRRKLMLFADVALVYTEKEALDFDSAKVFGLNNGLQKVIGISSDSFESALPLKGFFIGRLTDKANFEILINSLEHINRDFEFHIIGDGQHIAKYKELASKIKNPQVKIIWYGAIFDENEIQNIALKCHFFIYPGSVGLSLIHAFNYGLPAIIHDDELLHMPEFSAFKLNYNGLTFKHNDPISLADTLNNIDTEHLLLMKENALETVNVTFNTHDMANRFTNAIEQI